MTALPDVEEIALLPPKKSLPAAMHAYKFQPGHQGLKGAGRPKGMKNAQTSILDSAPYLAKQYIKRAAKSDAICIDARKWILPIEEDTPATGTGVIVVIAEGAAPRSLSDVADSPASALPALSPPAIDAVSDAQRR